MATRESIGIQALESIHYYVRDLERSRRFYTQSVDFTELGSSHPDLEAKGKQRSAAFKAGGCVVICSQPIGEGGRAWRYLRKHPDGVGTLNFEVADVEHAFRVLESRDATFIDDIQRFEDGQGGKLAYFSITTPFGDTTFRFLQRDGYRALYPGMVQKPAAAETNRHGFLHFDHVTSNFQTMKPALLWLEHVLGFQRFWDISFHTDDVKHSDHEGSGLKSVVMWDPKSGMKFANNEPYRPFFKKSQINIFSEENRGDGVQHVALAVRDILSATGSLRQQGGVQFMTTPGSYYDALPERLKRLGVGHIDEKIEDLRRLELLVDGDREHSYLLQIFMKDAASLYGDPRAGPFFFEIIQRKGDQGFGGGNFRALFESIERDQKETGKI